MFFNHSVAGTLAKLLVLPSAKAGSGASWAKLHLDVGTVAKLLGLLCSKARATDRT